MPQYTCEACRTSLYSAGRAADLIDRSCPSCGVSLDHARSAATRARRPAPIRMAASTDHRRIVDRFAAFMARGRPDDVARLDADTRATDATGATAMNMLETLRDPTPTAHR
jgi:hypothetical protein